MNKKDFIAYFNSTKNKGSRSYLKKNGDFRGEAELNKQLTSNPTLMKSFPGVSSFFDITKIEDIKKLQRWVNKNKSLFGVTTGTPDISPVLGKYIKFLSSKGASSSSSHTSMSSSPTKDPIVKLLEDNKNLILQGAPGVGKTYITRKIAVSICDGETDTSFKKNYPDNPTGRDSLIKRYDQLVKDRRIRFITFHQSLDYEDFVEGLKPDINPTTKQGTGTFSVKDGLFKVICKDSDPKKKTTAYGLNRNAIEENKNAEPYVLIIDEINRANISKVLGELITLIEPSKRSGGEDPYSVILPYSQEEFSVPSNLFILGTMNTADRSLGSIDYAIRRRFAFETLVSDDTLVRNPTAKAYFNAIKELISIAKDDDFETDDIMIGHSYFMGDFDNNLTNKIIPLLLEYFRDGVLVYDKVKSSTSYPLFSSETGESKKVILSNYLEKKVASV